MMNRQTTDTLLMIRPVAFRYNEETAANNYYQRVMEELTPENAGKKAAEEFDRFVELLRGNDIDVIVVNDTQEPSTPDSIFPNNWVSMHADGRVFLYPMFAPNRRQERRQDILDSLKEAHGLTIDSIIDLSSHESDDQFLEGTGSMVLDRVNRLAYAALSPRTDMTVLKEFCRINGYRPVPFHAFQSVEGKQELIYHTNVMMSVGDKFAIVCTETIEDDHELHDVVESFEQSGKEIITITEDQANHFAGNMLQVHVKDNPEKTCLIMSTAAYQSLTQDQIDRIEFHSQILHSSLDTIEALGGGSARCMMAEVFLPHSTRH